ncbi:cyclic-di-AMP-binding protein CbpB [Streptococcus sp. zg-JUN1979]|uniref:cyclic-di-AMP-binding protein CbpB n=1 Tax=Streptococcus sp. zg-JUN1979 TaxID=3391450 RepID=UPI0039A56E1C
MIAKAFEDFLLTHLDHYLIDADDLAIFIDTHNADHVLLVLTANGLSRVPVITKDKTYVGTISIADVLNYKATNHLSDWEVTGCDIAPMVNTHIKPVAVDADLTTIMHQLVDYPFLPVVDEKGLFQGIITRKSILKAVNSLLHDFTNDYDIIAKDATESH